MIYVKLQANLKFVELFCGNKNTLEKQNNIKVNLRVIRAF